MNVIPGAVVAAQFTVQNQFGALANGDSLPTGVLVRNGDDTAETVTITNISTGLYKYVVTIPAGYAVGDVVEVRANATVSALAGSGIVFLATVQSTSTIFPSGANEVTFTVNNSVTGFPIDGATVWISTDILGANVIWVGATDAFGVARNVVGEKPFLNNGTYYGWVQDSGYTDTNPKVMNVSP